MGAGSLGFNKVSIADPYSIDVLCGLDGRTASALRKLWQ
jgi:hypothetical protein